MDLEFELLKWGAYVFAAILGWFVRVLWTALEKMKEDFVVLQRELPLGYVRREEFREVIKEVKDSFKEAINPVLNKLDRMEEKWEEHKEHVDRTYQRKIGQ